MSAITEEFRDLAGELSKLYQKRKELSKEIIYMEERLHSLGLCLEFADELENSLDNT